MNRTFNRDLIQLLNWHNFQASRCLSFLQPMCIAPPFNLYVFLQIQRVILLLSILFNHMWFLPRAVLMIKKFLLMWKYVWKERKSVKEVEFEDFFKKRYLKSFQSDSNAMVTGNYTFFKQPLFIISFSVHTYIQIDSQSYRWVWTHICTTRFLFICYLIQHYFKNKMWDQKCRKIRK